MTEGVKEVKEGISKKELRLHISFFSEHCGYQVLTVKLFANYVHFSVFASSAGFLLFPLNLTRKQPKVCMFYLFLFLQNNLLTSTELNAIYSDFTDRSVAGCGTSSPLPQGAERHPAQFSPLLFLGT